MQQISLQNLDRQRKCENMRLSIVSFSEKGILLSKNMAGTLGEMEYTLYTKCSACGEQAENMQFVRESIGEWAREQFKEENALLFIGACGIAVRAIAPHITDKLHDSPVLVMDEMGQYIIPILSGHMGGANELAMSLAEKTGATAIITTATDINHKFAVDLFAKKNGLDIAKKEDIAKVSSKVLAGKRITISIETGHLEKSDKLPQEIEIVPYPPRQPVDVVITSENREFENAMLLKPKEYVIGIGCRKGKEAEKIDSFIGNNLQKAEITLTQIFAVASIDVKKEEPGLLAWSRNTKIPFVTYIAEELKEVEGDIKSSAFVERQVGVDNVCERAALKMCAPHGKLIYEKYAEDGMTIAIAKREWSVKFDDK